MLLLQFASKDRQRTLYSDLKKKKKVGHTNFGLRTLFFSFFLFSPPGKGTDLQQSGLSALK